MDNSPLWDAALERMAFDADQLPEYQRVDVELADATERPSDGEYDRYVYLVDVFRELEYDASRIRDVVPFAIQPVLFNSLLVQSNRDLAEIARIVGSDPATFESWAESTAAALDETLWDEENAVYVDYDVREGAPVGARTAAGLAPLYAGVPHACACRADGRGDGGLAGAGRPGRLGDHEPGSPRSGLPACPLLARPDLAHPELGTPARARSLRVPAARRRCSPCDHRAGARCRFPRALQPRDGSRPGWRGVRVDGSARSRSPEREWGQSGRGDPLTSPAFFVTSAWQLAGRGRWSGASLRDRRSMGRSLRRRRVGELRSRACVGPSGRRMLPIGTGGSHEQ